MYNLIEYSSNYSETTGSLWFYSKHKATNFDVAIENTVSFKSFKYKTKLLGNTVTQPALNNAYQIIKNATIGVPLKYLSTFWRSRGMPIINCKVELKFKWTKYCDLSAAGNDNTNANSNNFNNSNNSNNFHFKRHKIIRSSSNFISKRESKIMKTLVKDIAKDLKDQFIGINIKQKTKIKIQLMNIDIFSIQILSELIIICINLFE